MLNEVLIRVDGSAQIGLGHVVRCIALAQMLKDDFQIHFISNEIPDSIIEDISSNGFDFTKIESEEIFFKLLTGKEIVVLDNYFFDTAYQKRIKEISGCKLVCIDDLHDKEFYADLIINHSPSVKYLDYNAKPATIFALGLGYALLRPAFLKAAKRNREIEVINSILICFGGSDFKNITKIILEALKECHRFNRIIVILGTAYSHKDSLQEILAVDRRIEVYQSLKESEMLEKMESAHIAIVPASGILLEAIAVGCIPLICYYADNQKKTFDHLITEFKLPNFDILNFNKNNFLKVLNSLHPNKYSSVNVLKKKISNSSLNNNEVFKKLHSY